MRYIRGIGYLFVTNLIYLAIPLIGWGLRDLTGFFSIPQRLLYAIIIFLFGCLAGIQAVRNPEGIRGGQGREDALVPRQRTIRNLIIIMLYVALWYLPFADRRNIGSLSGQSSIRWVGISLFALGMSLIFWSGIILGKMYSADVTLQENHRLVTNGPYKYIRHPRYTGGILLAFGMSLLYNSWVGLTLSFAFIGVIIFRIRDEEALMQQAFGQEWEHYCQRTRRLFPFLY
jgi:protein-S-isoprenylcysteine O-methyltransferase Ste14